MVDIGKLLDEVEILSAAARYDASCASSGCSRPRNNGIGNGRPAAVGTAGPTAIGAVRRDAGDGDQGDVG